MSFHLSPSKSPSKTGSYAASPGSTTPDWSPGSPAGGHHARAASTPTTPSVPNLNDDIAKKKELKYDVALEKVVRAWVSDVLAEPLDEAVCFHTHFKSGVLLCRLINAIKPGTVRRINESTVSFKHLENIGNYLKACAVIGLLDVHLFNSIDLYENKDLALVVNNLAVLAKFAARVEGYTGPHLAGERRNVVITTSPSPPLFENLRASKKSKWRKSIKPPTVAPLNLDISTKEAFKYSPELERAAQVWIEALLGETFPIASSFRTTLKDGIILCRAINAIRPNTIAYINMGTSGFKQMENIANYLIGCTTLGLNCTDLFDTTDLYEEKNINLVIANIHVLANHALKAHDPDKRLPVINSQTPTQSGLNNKLYASLVHARFGPSLATAPRPDDYDELLAWINGHLKARSLSCSDMTWDLKNGVLLLTLLEELTSQRVGIYTKEPILPWHFMQNIFLLLNFMRENSSFNAGSISAHENFDREHFFKSVPVDTRRQKVFEEIVATESAYVKNLSVVFHTLIVQLSSLAEADNPCITNEDIFSVFGNWEKILVSHAILLKEFENIMSTWSDESIFGDIFVEKCGFLKETYSDYINNYDNSYQRIKRFRKANQLFDDSVTNFEVIQDSVNGLDLYSYLIMPIQRIPRYLLLLKEVVKYTPNTHRDYSLLLQAKESIRLVADHVNESKMMFDNTRKIAAIQESVANIPMALNKNEKRRYIREGFLEIEETFDKNSYFFLFNDILLYVKYKPSEVTGKEFKFKEVFQLSDFVDVCDILSDDEDDSSTLLAPPPVKHQPRGGLSKKKRPSFEVETSEFTLVLIAESDDEKQSVEDEEEEEEEEYDESDTDSSDFELGRFKKSSAPNTVHSIQQQQCILSKE
eukprot:gene11899-13864_t